MCLSFLRISSLNALRRKSRRGVGPLPAKQLGVLATPTSYTLQEFPVPSPGEKEVLIKNVAVASNPKDYKLPADDNYAFIEGNDVAGFIVAVGEGVSEYKEGDRVAAFAKMRMKDNKVRGQHEFHPNHD